MSEHSDSGAADFEEVSTPPDPLDELTAKVTLDVEAAYEVEGVAVMAELCAANVGAYFKACARLKVANSLFSKTAMDRLVHKVLNSELDFGARESAAAADILLKLAEPAFLFVADGTREPFADIEIDGTRRTHHLEDVDFSDWLINRYLDATQKAPPTEALNIAGKTLAAKARRGPKLPVFSRIGHTDGKRFMDRGTEDRSVIEIDTAGYRAISGSECPVRFIRPADGMGELPVPESGGSIDDLKPFLNLCSEDHFILAVGWILGCFLTTGAYPIELLVGRHGSGKTFIQRRQCDLVDPLIDELWSPAKNETDVVLAAQRTLVQPYDNVIEISADRAAVYCRMATGGKIRTRRLFTNGEEFTMRARRPMLMNATHPVMTTEDLIDRTIFLDTKPDALDAVRKSDKALAAEFIVAWPKLLGALLTAVSEGLRREQEPPPENLPRMADFATWVSRCETGLGWAPGTFLTAYRKNIRYAACLTGGLDPVAAAVINLMEERKTWKDTATKLLRELRLHAGDGEVAGRDWPKSPNWLSHRLEELATLLRRNDIAVTFQHSTNRTITLTKLAAPDAGAAP